MESKNYVQKIFDKLIKEFIEAENETLGQHWHHSLPGFRNWEIALNVIHLALKSKSHYVGIVTNTRRRLNKIVPGIGFERRKEDLPEELEKLMSMKKETFNELNLKIHDHSIKASVNKDIWYFSTPWKEFEEGTTVIPLHQKQEKKFIKKGIFYNRAFVILRKNCSLAAQNQIMYIIHQIFDDKKNIKKILRLAALEFVKQPTKKKIKPQYKGRLPGRLIILLRNDYETTIRTITKEEHDVLLGYFQFLKDMNESKPEHERLELKIKTDGKWP